MAHWQAARWRDIIQWQTFTGDPVPAGGLILRPQSQALILRAGKNGALVWNRPLAVLVESDSQAQRIPIRDTTRLVELAVVMGFISLVTLSRLIAARRAAGGR
jgi:hypothetical protein